MGEVTIYPPDAQTFMNFPGGDIKEGIVIAFPYSSTPTTTDLGELAKTYLASLLNSTIMPNVHIDEINTTNYSLSSHPELRVVYSGTVGQTVIKIMEYKSIIDGKIYSISYSEISTITPLRPKISCSRLS